MCVIVSLAPKQTVPTEILRNCYDHNHDGWGIMWVENGKVGGWKCVGDFSVFLKTWREVPRHLPRGVHFRIKTHGEVNRDNCHPFLIGEELGVMHNGTIQCPMPDAGMSDTHNFVYHELQPFLEGYEGNYMADVEFAKLLEDVTGWSKLLLMRKDGTILRTREKEWHKQGGIYFSNQHSLTKVYTNYCNRNTVKSYSPKDYDGCLANSVAKIGEYAGMPPYGTTAYEDWWALHEQRRQDNAAKLKLYHSKPVTEVSRGVLAETTVVETSDAEIAELEDRPPTVAELFDAQSDEINPNPVEEAETSEETVTIELDEIAAMSDKELLGLVQDLPISAVDVIRALLNTCLQASIEQLDVTKNVCLAVRTC